MLEGVVIHSLKTDIFEGFKTCPKVTRNAGISMTLKLRFLLFTFLTLGTLSAVGQVSFDSPAELEKAANEFFQGEQYDKAKPLYSQLLSLNALDPNYNYRFGVCILYTEADPLKPLPYIEGGANTTGVNSEAYYFLGKAYQFNYRFDDAISYFEKAKKSGFTSEGINLNRSIEECRNGKLLYSEVEFAPAQNKEVIESEFYRPYDFRKLKGKVIPMPPSFKTKYDQKNLRGTVVYTPSNSQTLIYASYGEDGANGKDLYRVNRLPSGEWALPQRLPDNINTKFDEDYAFFDSQSSTLYFASQGHNTMGGYDIFRSVFSAEDNTWSQPVNLQYPINSPYDDFLYVSDPNGKVAFFTSKRESAIGKLRVFKTLLHDPSQVELSVVEGTYEDKTDSVFNYMLATVFDPKTNEVVGKYRSNKETGKYILILPPQNDYKLDVGPNESAGFEFDLDVPKHDEAKTLDQEITYDASGEDGTVTLTNYFNSSGKKDSIALAANRNRAEVEKGMAELPDRAAVLASREKVVADEVEEVDLDRDAVIALEKEIEAKKEEEAKRLAELAAKEEAKLMAELARNDSIEKAQLAAREAEEQKALAEAARKDSIAQAELALQAKLEREKAIVDSLAKVEKELAALREKEIADSTAAAVELAEQKKQAELDSLAEVELAMIAQREKAVADSISKAETLALEERAKEKALQDSLAKATELAALDEKRLERERAINDSIANAERLALEAQLLEEAAAKKDSAEVALATKEQPSVEEESFEDLLKEMQEKEAEILANQEKEKALDAQPDEVPTNEAKNKPVSEEDVATVTNDTSATNELISEADLFLETLANLEEQSAAQQKEVEEENERLAKEKAAKEEEKLASVTTAVDSASTEIAEGAQVAISDSVKTAVEETKDIETQSVALKSDADPDEYLAALAEMEIQMEAEQASNSKSYELTELEPMVDTPSDVDPKLQEMLDADRKALEEHQRIAAEKEKELEEELARDKETLENVIIEPEAGDELAAIEAEMLNGLENAGSRKKMKGNAVDTANAVVEEVEGELVAESSTEIEPVAEPKPAEEEVVETPEPDLIAEADALVNELGNDEPVDNPVKPLEQDTEPVVEAAIEEVPTEPEMPQAEKAEQELIAEADQLVNEINQEAEVETVIEPEQTEVAAEVEIEVEQLEEEAEIVEEKAEEVASEENVTSAEEQVIEEVAEAVETVAALQEPEPKIVEQNVESEKIAEPVVVAETTEEVDLVVNEFGQQIPFLEPAMRDYSNRPKPNFKSIENTSMRRMIQRMRAEDIGRLAVIKNMKNQWVDQGKTQEAISAIKQNKRNQEVLANLVEPVSREEKVRDPFDKNDARAREGVHYQLEFQLVSSNVSETVTEAMSPEQEMTFAMPEFSITTDHFQNLADARAEKRYYNQRGFDAVEVVAYLNGDRILLSDAKNIPFVD